MATLKSIGTIKLGDTFCFSAEITDKATGDPLTGAASKLRCQGRNYLNGDLIAELTVTETSTPGTYLFSAGTTETWNTVQVLLDIQYTDGDLISSTETFYVAVEGDITHA